VLFQAKFAAGIADGSVNLTFRRWKRCQVAPGRTYRTTAGRIEVESVEVVDPEAITNAAARRAGYPDAPTLVADLRGTPDLPVYRVSFRPVPGPDPRDLLAADATLTADDVARIDERLARLDAASSHGPWTDAVLRVIAERPATRAPELAESFGRETAPFKIDVRKLKDLGLTISLPVGYRLSPRGEAYLRTR